MRYAIVSSGGKQYVAREGQSLEVDRLERGAGETIEFSDVLLAADGASVMVGSPSVSGARVLGTVQGEVRGEKIIVFRYQPKKRRRRKLGHRQTYTRVRIDQIEVPGLERSAEEPAPARAAARARPPKQAPSAAAPAKTASRKPAASKPAARKPAASKPAASKPASSKPSKPSKKKG